MSRVKELELEMVEMRKELDRQNAILDSCRKRIYFLMTKLSKRDQVEYEKLFKGDYRQVKGGDHG